MYTLFSNESVNADVLKRRAFNYRWAIHPPDVIPLTAADPDFPVCAEVTDALHAYLAEGYFPYGRPDGDLEFKKAVASWYWRRKHASIDEQLVLPVNSAAYGLFVCAQLICRNLGDEVLIPDPVDFLFRKSIEHAGGVAVPCRIDSETAAFDFEMLEQKVNARTKAIFICNPNNPLGRALSKDELNRIIQFAKKHTLWLVSDEIWSDIDYDDSCTSIFDQSLEEYEKKLVVSGLSKNFALAGLRIGYIIASTDKIHNEILASSLHQTTAFGIPLICQIAGTAALNNGEYWLEAFLKHLAKMRDKTTKFVDNCSFLESRSTQCSYLAFPKLKLENANAADVVAKILELSKVALVPGGKDWFESMSEGHIRICFSTSEAILDEAFARIKSVEQLLV
jgi:aspartate/methionine/tyrosine aminotransferase